MVGNISDGQKKIKLIFLEAGGPGRAGTAPLPRLLQPVLGNISRILLPSILNGALGRPLFSIFAGGLFRRLSGSLVAICTLKTQGFEKVTCRKGVLGKNLEVFGGC